MHYKDLWQELILWMTALRKKKMLHWSLKSIQSKYPILLGWTRWSERSFPTWTILWFLYTCMTGKAISLDHTLKIHINFVIELPYWDAEEDCVLVLLSYNEQEQEKVQQWRRPLSLVHETHRVLLNSPYTHKRQRVSTGFSTSLWSPWASLHSKQGRILNSYS